VDAGIAVLRRMPERPDAVMGALALLNCLMRSSPRPVAAVDAARLEGVLVGVLDSAAALPDVAEECADLLDCLTAASPQAVERVAAAGEIAAALGYAAPPSFPAPRYV
jgi:hypothetical protein